VKATDVDDKAMSQLALMNDYGWNVYAGVNPRPHSCSDVAEIVALHVDVDGLPKKADVPEPTLIVNSGHGLHLYWELGKAVPPSESIADINRGLAQAVGGDPHCCDITRILRVPGMTNQKEPKRVVTIELESEKRWRVEEFEGLGMAIDDRASGPTPHKEMRGLIFADAIKRDSYLRRAWNGGFGDAASDSRHIAILRLHALGFDQSVIEELVGSHRWYNTKTKRVTPREKAIADVRRVLAKA